MSDGCRSFDVSCVNLSVCCLGDPVIVFDVTSCCLSAPDGQTCNKTGLCSCCLRTISFHPCGGHLRYHVRSCCGSLTFTGTQSHCNSMKVGVFSTIDEIVKFCHKSYRANEVRSKGDRRKALCSFVTRFAPTSFCLKYGKVEDKR